METHFRNMKFLNKRNFIILGLVVLIGIFLGSTALTKQITIKDGNKAVKLEVLFSNVANAIQKSNLVLGDHDQVSYPLDSKVKDGMIIQIKRAHPVNVYADQKDIQVMTAYEKVEDILKEHKIKVGKKDKVQPALDEKVGKDETIKIARVKEKIVAQQEAIPFQSVIKYNQKLDQGKINIMQKGENGEKEVKYKIIYEDGVETSKEWVEEKIIVNPKNEIVEKGTAIYVATSRGSISAKNVVKMTATAYDCSYASTGKYPGHPYHGITSSGTRVRPGVVAVDPKVIPLGTKLYIKALDGSADYGFAVAEDTGGAIKGNKIDLYFESPKDTKRYGRRKVLVYILK
ncbi:3D domain-containing protein [Inediibacterium massiliense]|uniref:3D domain-containing protein n=1 Tax=Inediibacterium massiliense TaxID=1658111 RepID=UPI0006B65FBF|nr:3D domain-containing protein [Inediibacterium massiliense]